MMTKMAESKTRLRKTWTAPGLFLITICHGVQTAIAHGAGERAAQPSKSLLPNRLRHWLLTDKQLSQPFARCRRTPIRALLSQ